MAFDDLVGGRTGLVGVPEPGPGPWLLPVVDRFRSVVHTPWSPHPLTAVGAAVNDQQAAWQACVAEGVERYCASAAADREAWSSTGCAAGRSLEAATEAACWELLERHQLAEAWYRRMPLSALPIPGRWQRSLAGTGIRPRVRVLPGRVPAAIVVLHEVERRLLGAGAAARPTMAAAVDKAMCEAIVSLAGSFEVADPGSRVLNAAVADGVLRPWRADRRYGNSYRTDRSDVVDLACHTQLLLDPDIQDQVLSRLDQPSTDRRVEEVAVDQPLIAGVDGEVAASSGRDAVADHGDVTVSDLTTADVAMAGLRVVRVECRGLRDIVPAAERPDVEPVPLT